MSRGFWHGLAMGILAAACFVAGFELLLRAFNAILMGGF